VAVDDQLGLVGFYSLSAFSIGLGDVPEDLATKLPHYDAIPAALIGRLARDVRARGQHVGDFLLADAIGRVLEARERLGVFAIVRPLGERQRLLQELWLLAVAGPPRPALLANLGGGTCTAGGVTLAEDRARPLSESFGDSW
jgi:hypothetical protein